jgi:hypothetical protein
MIITEAVVIFNSRGDHSGESGAIVKVWRRKVVNRVAVGS